MGPVVIIIHDTIFEFSQAVFVIVRNLNLLVSAED